MPRKLVPFAALCLVALLARADQPFNIRPGLWKTTVTVDSGIGRDSFSRMSCITGEDIRAGRLLQMQGQDDPSCRRTITRQSADILEGTIECSGARRMRTEVHFAASSPENFTANLRSVAGTTPAATLVVTGQWVAGQCPDEDEEESGNEP